MYSLKQTAIVIFSLALFSCSTEATPVVPHMQGRIAFSSNQTGVAEIYIMDFENAEVTQLTQTEHLVPIGQNKFSESGIA